MADIAQPKRRRSGFFTLLLAIAILIATSVAAISLWSRAQVSEIRELYEARGYPTSLEALDAWYAAVPPEGNAAVGFLAAWKASALQEQADQRLLPVLCTKESCKPIDLNDPLTLEQSEALVAKNAEALKFARVAAKLDASRYPANLTQWPLMLTHSEKVSDVVRLLLLEAAVAAHKGDTARATDAFVAAYACARSFTPEPLLLAQLVVRQIQNTVDSHVATALGVTAFTEADLDRLLVAARSVNEAASLERSVAGEAVFGLYSDSPANPLARAGGGYDRAEYARLIRMLLDATALPLPEAVRVYEGIDRKTPGGTARITKPITVLLTSTFPDVCLSDARGQIKHELFATMIAVEKFRIKHGMLPKELTELVPEFLPELRSDPYGAGPYRYVLEEKGYRLLSDGRDRSENEPNIELHVER